MRHKKWCTGDDTPVPSLSAAFFPNAGEHRLLESQVMKAIRKEDNFLWKGDLAALQGEVHALP